MVAPAASASFRDADDEDGDDDGGDELWWWSTLGEMNNSDDDDDDNDDDDDEDDGDGDDCDCDCDYCDDDEHWEADTQLGSLAKVHHERNLPKN